MAKGGKASGKNTLMMKTATPPATRSTRSTTGQSKRKRALTNSSEQGGGVASKKKPHVSNSPEPSNDEADSEDAEGAAVQRSSRVAPVHPMFSSSQASDEDEGDRLSNQSLYLVTDSQSKAQASDGLISSDIEAGTLTAKQINAERPTLVQNCKPTNTRAANTVRVGKRAAQALDEVPSTVQPQSPIEGNSQDAELDNVQPSVSPDVLAPLPDTAMPGAPPVVLALVPDTALPGAPPQAVIPVPVLTPTVALPPAAVAPLFPQPVNIWLAATNLIVGEDGRLQQSSQSPEISKYISKTVRLASLNIFFVDAFPDPEKQSTWLSQSLVAVLRDQAKTDMTTGRWCNARQLVIDHARALIESEGCSYEINGELATKPSESERAEMAGICGKRMNSERESRDTNRRTRQKTTGKPENETTDNKQRETSGYVGTTESEIGTPAGLERPEGRRDQRADENEGETTREPKGGP
ncbi:hypothetical protein BJ322DRAFT_1019918 [Thelephora terrestris]|uniref:Uncharacterized protein n=1 Tax=Thelephora terrestris TaxID=56493 RepID=A0A9P6HIN0_9AGAM|nr:hypothetical protein BJ322DRAFT_1019918 [Thelephora terrestris]